MISLPSNDTLVLTLNAKSTVDQLYNDTNAMALGREFDPEQLFLLLTGCHQGILRDCRHR